MCFIIIVLMLSAVMVSEQLQARRSIAAEVTNFVDEVTDTGVLNEKHVADLYLACSAYGPLVDVQVTTFKRVNPIEGPTVLAFIDGWDFKTTHAISAFSIGGAQIEASRMVAGYEAINPDGSVTKMYAYADLLPENKHVIDMFTSVEEAAKAGYYYDPIFMG